MWPRLQDWYRSAFGHAAIGAVVLWAALPPLDLWPLAWIAPVWWILLVRRSRWTGRQPYAAFWLAGFLFWLAALHWLRLPHWATSFGWVALSAYLAFYLPVFVGLTRVAVHRLRVPVILAAPIVWAGLELPRAHLLTGFRMASLGHTQYRWIELIQLSDLVGAYGVDFVVMFAAACIGRMIPFNGKPRAVWPLVPAVAVVAAAVLYGYVRTSGQHTAPGARVVLIQGSIDTEVKADESQRAYVFKHYFDLSQQALTKYKSLDLIVWPETMFRDSLVTFDPSARMPDDWNSSPAEFRQALETAARQSHRLLELTAEALRTPLILGVETLHYGSEGIQRFNSAVFLDHRGRFLGRYDKMHLVMFGEYMPLARYFPWLHRLTPVTGSADAGTQPVVFSLGSLRMAPNICYESVLSHVIRGQINTLARAGQTPDVLVNLTNDGWFWGSSELDMHLVCGVLLAVECRKPLLIAANTGFSAWIDADGRILRQGPRRQADTILAEVQRDLRSSWYLEHGDLPAGVCLAACVFFAAVGLWRGKRSLP